jgi:hypothetical protein
MFELAVTAAASIGAQLTDEGYDARFVTDLGEVPRQGSFHDTLLDTLAVLRPSRSAGLDAGVQALGATGGQLIAVLGSLPAGQARELAQVRRGTAPGLALILAEDEWDGAGMAASVQTLIGAGWRVALVQDAARLPAAWQELHRGGAAGGRATAPSAAETSPRPGAVS